MLGGAITGALAGAAALAAIFGLGLLVGQPTFAETIADGIARLTPVEIIEAMIETFGSAAKRMLFAVTLAGIVAASAGLGAVIRARSWGLLEIAAASASLIGLVGLLVLPILGMGLLGAASPAGAGATLASLAVAGVLFLLFYAATSSGSPQSRRNAAGPAPSRRVFLKQAAALVGGLAVGGGLLKVLSAGRLAAEPSTAAAPGAAFSASPDGDGLLGALRSGVPGLSPEITPTDRFYVVSKNVLRDPDVNQAQWRLEIAGLVERPVTFSYDDIRRLPAANQYFTLQCISNRVGGNLIGNGYWRGVELGEVLRQAGVRPEAVDVVLRAADDYADSIPVAKALAPGTMLAYEMNGEILPKNHGFPVRLLVPDIYGMKNVKWITKIELVDHDFKGFWQTRGWNDVAVMNTTSRVDLPTAESELAPGTQLIGGVAVAGARGIERVEVSTDGGQSWRNATIKPALGPNAWVLWLAEWEVPAETSRHTVLVRAIDGSGTTQPMTVQRPFPNGASGYHAVTVRTADA